MPRRCTICESEGLDEINRLLVEGRISFRRIASLYDVSEASARHVFKRLFHQLLFFFRSLCHGPLLFNLNCSKNELSDHGLGLM